MLHFYRARGLKSVQYGRMSADDLNTDNTGEPVDITDPVLLIRINKEYRPSMTDSELMEATRGIWKVGERRYGAKFALCLFNGVVREVYEITGWQEAGSRPYLTRSFEPNQTEGRWEFEGHVALEPIRSRYLHRSVRGYFNQGQQNPIKYINC